MVRLCEVLNAKRFTASNLSLFINRFSFIMHIGLGTSPYNSVYANCHLASLDFLRCVVSFDDRFKVVCETSDSL